MDFHNLIKIWAVLLVLIILVVVGQATKQDTAFSIVGCEDYVYKMNLNVVPTNLFVYTMDNGVQANFKTDYATENYFDTILHCGHKYKIVYSSDGYQNYTEQFEIGKYIHIPLSTSSLEGEVKQITLTK